MRRSTRYNACYRLVLANGHKKIGGTCLVVRHRNLLYVITARHCIDKKYRNPSEASDLPNILRVQGVVTTSGFGYDPSHDMDLHVSNWVFGDSDNDVAVAKIDGFSQEPIYIWHTDLIETSRRSQIEIGTEVVFSGYPEGIEAADPTLPSMVLRRGIVASQPAINIAVPGAIGRDYCLIDAFSQNGFSGAPIFALIYRDHDLLRTLTDFAETLTRKRISFFGSDPVVLQSSPDYKFLGLNCGHFKTVSDRSNGVHAGLSYYVRATVVTTALTKCAELPQLDNFVTVGTANGPLLNEIEILK